MHQKLWAAQSKLHRHLEINPDDHAEYFPIDNEDRAFFFPIFFPIETGDGTSDEYLGSSSCESLRKDDALSTAFF